MNAEHSWADAPIVAHLWEVSEQSCRAPVGGECSCDAAVGGERVQRDMSMALTVASPDPRRRFIVRYPSAYRRLRNTHWHFV